jgi:hypothetical protein
VITPAGRKENEAMGRSIARSAGCTRKGKDFMSLAEVWPCHGEQRSMMRRARAIHDPVASSGTCCCRLRHLQFKPDAKASFSEGRWQADQSA